MQTVNPSTSLRINGERSRTIKFYTLGCKVNQYDAQRMREGFMNAGFKELEARQPAGLYVINTCTVTQAADSSSLSLIRRAKRENPKARIIVSGCLAELDEDKIKKQGKNILIVKNKDKEKLFNTSNGISYFKNHTRAFLKIQDGCNNFCSYCKVPLVRGPSRSKNLSAIVNEAKKLVRNGVKEIVLTGICLGAYGRDLTEKIELVDVIRALENLDGLLRIRLSSIEAGDISDRLIRKIAESKKICPHLHIPLQSGDDELLKKMKRNYSSNDYLTIISKIKKLIPQAAITTDVLAGFPGESEENFQNTLNLIKEISPLKTYIFPYSPRMGTAASKFNDALNPMLIRQRVLRLKQISSDCSLIYKRRFLNKKMQALIEGRSKDGQYWEGYTGNYIKVGVKSELALKNKLITLRLKKPLKNALPAVLGDLC